MTNYDPSTLRSSAEVAAIFRQISDLQDLTAALRTQNLETFIFGGAVRDAITFGSVPRDIDVVTVDGSANGSVSATQFEQTVAQFANTHGFASGVARGMHITLQRPESGVAFDVLYPVKDVRDKLARTEFAIHAIGFDCSQEALLDPYGGIEDLKLGRLRVHSPEFFIPNPPHFSRTFRIAALLGLAIEPSATALIQRYAHLIAIHDGKANLPAMAHLLKFFSVPKIKGYLSQFVKLKLLSYFVPEIAPLQFEPGNEVQYLKRNLASAERFDFGEFPSDWEAWLETAAPLAGTCRGYLRLAALMLGLGDAYSTMAGSSPFSSRLSTDNPSLLSGRLQENLINHMALRYRDHSELYRALREIHAVLELSTQFLRSSPTELSSEIAKARGLNPIEAVKKAVAISAVCRGSTSELPPIASFL